MANFNRVSFEEGPWEYPGFIPSSEAMKRYRLSDGNTVIQDKQGHLFNVHPLISERYNKETGKNEKMAPSYPVRWQLMSFDVPEEIKDRIQ